jgi:hypothetical protein
LAYSRDFWHIVENIGIQQGFLAYSRELRNKRVCECERERERERREGGKGERREIRKKRLEKNLGK